MQESLHSLVDHLRMSGELYTDFGPKNPVAANQALQSDLERVLLTYPFLKDDAGYIEFLECYAGLSYTQKKYLLSVDLFGISPEISTHLLDAPGEPISPDGILTFCSISLVENLNQPRPDETQGIGFGFESTGKRQSGVYYCLDSGPYTYYCSSFLDWMRSFVDGSFLNDLIRHNNSSES